MKHTSVKQIKFLLVWIVSLIFSIQLGLASHITNDLLWSKTIVYLKDDANDFGPNNLLVSIKGSPTNITIGCAIGIGCIYFDGVDDALIIDTRNNLLNAVANRTICFAMNYSSASRDTAHTAFYKEKNVGANTEDLYFYDDATEFRATFNEEIPKGSSNLVIDGTDFPNGAWEQYCVGVWYNGRVLNVSICKNNDNLNHQTFSHTDLTGKIKAYASFGYHTEVNSHFYQGAMDNLWIGNITPESEVCDFFWNNGNFRELSAPVSGTTRLSGSIFWFLGILIFIGFIIYLFYEFRKK